MRRNEVWWAELPFPSGPRPVLVLTRDLAIQRLDSIVAALVTRTNRGLATEVRLGRREGLSGPCVVNFDNIITIPKSRLTRLLGSLSHEKVEEANQALKVALDLP